MKEIDTDYAIYMVGEQRSTIIVDEGDMSIIKNAINLGKRFVYLESITTWINLDNVAEIAEISA